MGHCLGLHHTFFGEADCTYSNDCMGYPTELPQPGTNDGISNTGRDPNGTAATDCQSLENSSGGSCRDNNHIYDDIPFDNYMSYYFNCMNRFTNLQIEKMKFNIQNMFGTNPLELCCELPVNTDYTFNSGQTAVWNSNMDVSKIVIEQGAELTIQNATINFDAAGLIDNNGGKLILDNATLRLSPACGDNQWQGIKASYCGSEINIDNSTIRDAAIGVHIQNMVDCGTKVLDIDFSSLINNCNRGILIENSNDEVIIYNSEFENNSIAFETMNAENIKIEDCLFHNNGSIDPDLTPRGISLLNSKIRFLEGNTFDNTAMVIRGTHPQASRVLIGEPEKDRCVFQSDDPHTWIYLSSSGVEGDMGLMVENTKFKGAIYANVLWGSNSYTIKRSEFTDVLHSSFIVNTGGSLNSHQCNLFNNGRLVYNGLNASSDFLENDFKFYNPIIIRPDWRTNYQVFTATKPNIGTKDEGPANCFDFKSNALGVTADYDLIYYYFDDSHTSRNCQRIEDGLNYSTKFSTQPKNDCTQRGIYQRINPDGDTDPGILFETNWSTHISVAQVLNNISYYEQQLANADTSSQSATEQVQNIQDTLDEWINYALFRSDRKNDSLLAIQALTSLEAFKYKKKLVGVYLEEGMYDEAESLLSSMNTEDVAETLFVEVQEINLRHLKAESTDSIEYADIERLKEITYEPYPAAGFAYGLYHKFTGTLLKLPLDTAEFIFQPEPLINNTVTANSTKNSYVFPNPVINDFQIKSDQAFRKLKIFHLNGSKVLEQEFTETNIYSVESSKLSPGMYILQLLNDDQFIDRIKFVKQ